jgi:exosome complex component RRP4
MKGWRVGAAEETEMKGNEKDAEPRLVVPGEVIQDHANLNPGCGIIKSADGHIATRLGTLNNNEGTLHVQPINATYMPRSGDLVIGYIEAVQSNLWFLDVAGPFNALLPMSLAPWKVEFGDARNHMNVGEAVLARAQEVDESHSVVCTMKGVGLRKISEGHIVSIPVQQIPNIRGENGATIQSIKEASDCRIIVAENGRVWIDGDSAGIRTATKAIEVITMTGHRPDLETRLAACLAGGEV